MSSTASGLNALASTTAIDIYKRNLKPKIRQALPKCNKSFHAVLGIIAIPLACVGTLFEN
jgi:Na+/proline symporter